MSGRAASAITMSCNGCGRRKKPEPCGSGFLVGRFARMKLGHVARTLLSALLGSQNVSARAGVPAPHYLSYAVLRGRIVRSLICVRMLDICIPFSCETNGSISAMNGSFINSQISS